MHKKHSFQIHWAVVFFLLERQLWLYNQSPTNVVHKIWPNQRTQHSSIMIRNWSVFVSKTDPVTIASHFCTLIYPLTYKIVIQLNAHLHNSLFFGNTKQMMHTAAQKTLNKAACCIIFRHMQKIFLAHVFYIFFNRKKCLISIVTLTSYQYCSQQYGNP